jgi:lysophospholipase L1-like esterase
VAIDKGEIMAIRIKKHTKTRVLFLSNSQGTSAGLADDTFWKSYPHRVQDHFPEIECVIWAESDNSVANIDNHFNELVLQQYPDIIFLQCGIIEGSLRILPRGLKNILALLPGGKYITGSIRNRRRQWMKLLNIFRLKFYELDLHQFESHLSSIIKKVKENNIEFGILEIAPLSQDFINNMIPGNNQSLARYNSILVKVAKRHDVKLINSIENNHNASLNDLYIKNTVHFSVEGHELIAKNIINFINSSTKFLINHKTKG